MPIWLPVMAGKNDNNELHQNNLSCKGTGHLRWSPRQHIAIFHVCFGGHMAGHLGGCIAICHVWFGGCLAGHLGGHLDSHIFTTY